MNASDLLSACAPYLPADLADQLRDALLGDDPRAHPLPKDWQPDHLALSWAHKERPDLIIARETEKFREYWHAKRGKGARKRNWQSAFRNWCRNANGSLPQSDRAVSRQAEACDILRGMQQ